MERLKAKVPRNKIINIRVTDFDYEKYVYEELSRVNAVSILVLEIEHLTGKAARELIRDKKIS